MSKTIQNPSKDLTLIVYNSPKPPKYIKINKGLMRSLIIAIPILVITSIIFSIITSVYMKQKLETAKSHEPEVIIQLREETGILKSETEALKKVNEALMQKISKGANVDASLSGLLALFAAPIGFTDSRGLERTKIENMSNSVLGNKVIFKFDLLNNTGAGKRLSGYITIIQHHYSGLSVYPAHDIKMDSPQLQYSEGESFVVSRFRPVIAEFPKPLGSTVWYKIFIYSRTGDLLAYKTSGPHEIQ